MGDPYFKAHARWMNLKQAYGLSMKAKARVMEKKEEVGRAPGMSTRSSTTLEQAEEALGEDEISRLRSTFQLFDQDQSGNISISELRQCFSALGVHLDEEDVKLLVEDFDSDQSGEVDFSEFLRLCADLKGISEGDALQKAFQQFDSDGSGTVSCAELAAILKKFDPLLSDDDVLMMVHCADTDHSGEVSYAEFAAEVGLDEHLKDSEAEA